MKGTLTALRVIAGQRAVDLSPRVLEVLQAHRAAQAEKRLKRGADYKDGDLIFCTDQGRHLTNLKPLRKAFRDTLALANCQDVRIHDLRHTYASLLIDQNANPKYIQTQLGHASIQMTFDIYGHLMPQASRDTVEKLDRQVFGASH